MTRKAKKRKDTPVFTGVLKYFPDALMDVARASKAGNDQHHPEKPLHWDKSKSFDHADALARHLLDAGEIDDDGIRHSAKVAWRALAMLQIEIENEKRDEEEEEMLRKAWDEMDERMYDHLPIIEHSSFPNKEGLHPREAREERVRKLRLSDDRMNVVGQNGNEGIHYEVQTPEGQENN